MKFQFAKGDRVDFGALAYENGTPGTILNRVHTKGYPCYRIAWDDNYTEKGMYVPNPDIWAEDVLVALPGNDKEN